MEEYGLLAYLLRDLIFISIVQEHEWAIAQNHSRRSGVCWIRPLERAQTSIPFRRNNNVGCPPVVPGDIEPHFM